MGGCGSCSTRPPSGPTVSRSCARHGSWCKSQSNQPVALGHGCSSKAINVKKTEELINAELLAKEVEQRKSKRRGVMPGKLYVNTIKQVFSKFDIPAEYKLKELDDSIEITVSIPKNK